MQIFYLVPATDKPSWGMGIIYDHVYMLNKHGFHATVIKEKDCYVPQWLKLEVPVKDYRYLQQQVQPQDIVVVPEAMLNLPGLKKMQCRKLLFIQAPAYMFESMPAGENHLSLGFEHVMTIMPHMAAIVEKHVQLPYSMVPPYVADYFFNTSSGHKRKKQVLLFPKFHQIDYSIIKYLVERHINKKNGSWLQGLISGNNWSVKELKGYTHEEVAQLMQQSAIFISINTFEALNTSVTEAMAAGCLVFCYEGFGPRDYLRNNENAQVFPNNEAYLLAEAVCAAIDSYDAQQEAIASMQQEGYATARKYTRAAAEEMLIRFFTSYAGDRASKKSYKN